MDKESRDGVVSGGGGSGPEVVLFRLFTDVLGLDSYWKIGKVGLFNIFRDWPSLPAPWQ